MADRFIFIDDSIEHKASYAVATGIYKFYAGKHQALLAPELQHFGIMPPKPRAVKRVPTWVADSTGKVIYILSYKFTNYYLVQAKSGTLEPVRGVDPTK